MFNNKRGLVSQTQAVISVLVLLTLGVLVIGYILGFAAEDTEETLTQMETDGNKDSAAYNITNDNLQMYEDVQDVESDGVDILGLGIVLFILFSVVGGIFFFKNR